MFGHPIRHRRPQVRRILACSVASAALVMAANLALPTSVFAQTPPGGGNGGGTGGGAGGAYGTSGSAGVNSGGMAGGGGGGGANAAGGAGAAGSNGGAAGVWGVTNGSGANGGNSGGGTGGGGGGGGADATGANPAPAAVSTNATGGAGGNGGNFVAGANGGGGGGGGAGYVASGSGPVNVTSNLGGGTGGNGGSGSIPLGAGGDGGTGGVGLYSTMTSGAISISSGSQLSGGAGGTGGQSAGPISGAGGAGGAGAWLAGAVSLTNNGTITGGAGGAGGPAQGGFPPLPPGLTGANGVGVVAFGASIFNNGTISGGSGADAISFNGAGNTLKLGASSVLNGNISINSVNPNDGALTIDQSVQGNATLSNAITGDGALTYAGGANTLTLSGTSSYTGATYVNSGSLMVNGSIGSSSLTTVLNGAMLGGTGTVGGVQVNNGGTFAPGSGTAGTSMTVAGALGFQPGGIYQVNLNATTSSLANVTGTATLTGGIVKAYFLNGPTYTTGTYTILTSSTPITTQFASLTPVGLPSGFTASLFYDPSSPNIVQLNLVAAAPSSLPVSVAFSISDQTTVIRNKDVSFMTYMYQMAGLPTVDLSNIGIDVKTLHYATLETAEDGYASRVFGAFPSSKSSKAQVAFEPHWSVWASGSGDFGRFSGYTPTSGSVNSSSSTAGVSSGFNYSLSPTTTLGFAFGGGETHWRSPAVAVSGGSQYFQSAIHGTTTFGQTYVSGLLGFSNNWVTTSRLGVASDLLQGQFAVQSYFGRLEGGLRMEVASPVPLLLRPYLAVQPHQSRLPGYTESELTPGGTGALSYAPQTTVTTRSEIGTHFETLVPLDKALLSLSGTAAYAHDRAGASTIWAQYLATPGPLISAAGIGLPTDIALLSAKAEMRLQGGVSLFASSATQLSARSQNYSGNAGLKYTW